MPPILRDSPQTKFSNMPFPTGKRKDILAVGGQTQGALRPERKVGKGALSFPPGGKAFRTCPQGNKKRRVRNLIPYTAPYASAETSRPCTKKRRRSIIVLQMRGENRCVWRELLRMQGAGWWCTPFLLCIFHCPCMFYYNPGFRKFQPFL